MSPEKVHKMIEKRCREEGLSDPNNLTSPSLQHSPLQGVLEKELRNMVQGIKIGDLMRADRIITMVHYSAWTPQSLRMKLTLGGQ